MINLQEIQKSY